MLKRKAASASSSALTKYIKTQNANPPKNLYEASTISQTSDSVKRTPVSKVSLHPETYSVIAEYLREYKRRVKSKSFGSGEIEKTIIIQGPPGCGKTFLVRQLGLDLNLKVLELNASANRSKVNILKILGEASQTFSIEKGENSGTIIFIDDVDIILEPDSGFYNGIKTIISSNKCPVIMTCAFIPKFLSSCQAKFHKLNVFQKTGFELAKKILSPEIPLLTEAQIGNIINKTQGNLNTIASIANLKELSFVYGPEVQIDHQSFVKILNPEGYFKELIQDHELSIDNPKLYSLFLDNLQQMDLIEKVTERFDVEGKYKVLGFYEGVEKTYLKYRNTEEEFSVVKSEAKTDYKKIAREHLIQMGDTEDFISYLQVLKEFPVILHPSYLLRHTQKNKATYFDIFLQKNTNQFNMP